MNKIAVVTGVASGIGRKIAKKLLQEGCIVYGLDIYHCDLRDVHYLQCDISQEIEVMEAFRIIGEEKWIDYLVNVAGIICCKNCYKIEELPVEEWDRVMEVNLRGAFLVAKYALPRMTKGSCILNFSTEQVKKPHLKSAPYAVTKAGIEMLTNILALEHISRGIRANTVALGTVETNFIRHMVKSEEEMKERMEKADSLMPLGLIQTEDVWKVVRYLLFDGIRITGQTILMESGMTIG